MQARAAQRVQDRLGGEHRREQRDDDAEAEGEGEALDARGGDDEEDERDQERDDVRVDDRRQALAVAGGDGRGDRSAGPHLLFDAFEHDDVRVGRDAERQDQARDARQRQRDRDQLDQRVEVQRVDAQRDRRDDAQDAVEDDQEERDDDEAGDARLQALIERLLAERRGDLRARDLAELQRQGADLEDLRQVLRATGCVKLPEIWAPVEPSMPSGFSRQLMYGAETSSLSSAIAKCCEVWSGSPPSALSAPRWATRA